MEHYIKVEKNVSLFVNDIGRGTPILCIHGWPVNHKMYEYQMNEIPKKGFRFIGVDLRGFGKSSHPWEGYTYDRMADDIRKVVDALKLKKFILAGFSMGGAVAIRYMARHKSHRVSKLMLFGAAAPSFVQRPGYSYGKTREEVNVLIKSVQTNRPKALEDFGKLFFYKKVDPSFSLWFQSLEWEASSYGTIFSLEALRDEDLRKDFTSITVPTAIFHGVLDKICPFEFAKEMNKAIKGSTLVPFEKSGHGLFFDELEKFNRELFLFLRA
ncbi:alpha/beta fold hydrolase [Peribacillus acanthi]|uniref:alpha/beta fold hydrolase n=1 Tax=Peribacillus acanthi TaxID=2171554 RepID=UPI000D3E377E|nr:alpha/beta hydrolase [Peribacillus acanthi]